jgi:hypothetical protein
MNLEEVRGSRRRYLNAARTIRTAKLPRNFSNICRPVTNVPRYPVTGQREHQACDCSATGEGEVELARVPCLFTEHPFVRRYTSMWIAIWHNLPKTDYVLLAFSAASAAMNRSICFFNCEIVPHFEGRTLPSFRFFAGGESFAGRVPRLSDPATGM